MKLKRVTNKQMVQCMRECIPCRAFSATAKFEDDGSYCVYSYDTLIFKKKTNGTIYFDNRKYSVTTSKLQGNISYAFGLSEYKERKVYGNKLYYDMKMIDGVMHFIPFD